MFHVEHFLRKFDKGRGGKPRGRRTVAEIGIQLRRFGVYAAGGKEARGQAVGERAKKVGEIGAGAFWRAV